MLRILFRKRINPTGVKYYSSQKRSFKEVKIRVPWGYIAGKWWEPYEIRPVLTLHGWQDNCGSFDRLIPLLTRDVGFLAIDFPGHGYSSRLPVGVEYTPTLYSLTVLSIQSQLKWPKISLMGHSLGGVTSYVYTMLYNDKVDFTICLDGAKPMVSYKVRESLSKALLNFLKYNAFAQDPNEPPSYTIEEIQKKICSPHRNSVASEHSHLIAQRNIAPSKLHPGKYYFTRDPRLKISIPSSFPQNQLVNDAVHIQTPIFIAKCKDAAYYEEKENFYEVINVLKNNNTNLDFHYVEGKHHAHFNTPELMSNLINSFIGKYNSEDRSIGGITDDIIVDQNISKIYN